MLIFQLNSPVVNIYHINLSLCLSMYVYRVLFSVLLFKFFLRTSYIPTTSILFLPLSCIPNSSHVHPSKLMTLSSFFIIVR